MFLSCNSSSSSVRSWEEATVWSEPFPSVVELHHPLDGVGLVVVRSRFGRPCSRREIGVQEGDVLLSILPGVCAVVAYGS